MNFFDISSWKDLFLSFLVAVGILNPSAVSTNAPSILSMPTNHPSPTPFPTPRQEQLHLTGHVPYWDRQLVTNSYTGNPSAYNELDLFWYYLNTDGQISRYIYAPATNELITWAHQRDIRVLLTIANLGEGDAAEWDSDRVETVIADADRRNTHAGELLALVKELDADGLLLDYESLDPDLEEEYTDFVRLAAARFEDNNKTFKIALHPKIDNPKEDAIGRYQNWPELAQTGATLGIMAYGEHWNQSEPGPVASLPWLENILLYARSLAISPEQLDIGLPLYGYDWNLESPEESATGLTFLDVQTLINDFDPQIEFQEAYATPHFRYTTANQDEHQVWFENAQSIQAKIDLIKSFGYYHLSFWRLGGEDPEVWQIF